MALLIIGRDGSGTDPWAPEIARLAPEIEVRHWPEIGDPATIDAVLMWKPPPGLMARLTNLKAILATGAGVDALLGDPEVPTHLPLARLVDPSMTAEMSEYVTLQVLRFHRQEPTYARQQRERVWAVHPQPHPDQRRIGMLGLGELGADALAKLAPFGFPLAGWSRSPRTLPGVTTFHGRDGIDALARRSDILICLLPLTDETRGILDRRLFALMPEGAFVINCARGGHLVDDDLLEALDSGHLAGAALDVFHTEPLPGAHPFWSHPKVVLTPHSSALTNPRTATPQIVDNLRRLAAGRPLVNLVDRTRGY